MNTYPRRRRSFVGMRKSSSSITYTKDEPWALCYYLYFMFKNKSNIRIIRSFDSAIRMLLTCCDMVGKSDRLNSVLNEEIRKLEKRGLLTKNKESVSEDMKYENSNIYWKYEQDHSIDREMSNYECIDENLINLHRILYVTEKPVFSTIINTVLFRNGTNVSLNSNHKLTKKLEKSIFDIAKTKFLMDQVKLSENEARYILYRCRISTIELFRDIVHSAENCDNNFQDRVAGCIGMSEKEYRQILRGDKKLKSFGFLDEDGCYEEELNECIEEQSIEPWFADMLKPYDCSNAYAQNSFSLKKETQEVILDLLNGKNPVSILFYGKPGSGKTELAKTLAGKTGKNIYIFKNETETSSRMNIVSRLSCLLSMERSDSIIIVDEADSILKTLDFSFFGPEPTKTKGAINKMLENNMDKVIYIINHQQQIDESTLRRFTFSVKFESMSASMLRHIAMNKLSQLDIADTTKKKLVAMFDRYRLTGTSVDNVIKAVESMQCKDEKIMLEKAGIVMKENSFLLYGKTKMRESVKKEYDPSVLNASMNALSIVDMVKNAARFAEKNKGTESGVRMLFYGLSGTGKTEFARYIAQKLGKPILLKRASDIMGMYVGQSEKHIRDAFTEAENNGAVLLFDEADSFFYNRNNAKQSWERSLVNEFLTQMEEFSGILICTTNLRNIMDPAMQRRFHILVEFKPMNKDGIKTMLERYFPAWSFNARQIDELIEFESVTPGDFGVLSGRIRFMNPEEINSEYIIHEIKKMQNEKMESWVDSVSGRPIGFTA